MIPLMKCAFANEELTRKALADFILRSERLSMGQECSLFEKEFAAYQGRKHAILFNSGGSANLAIMQTAKNLRLLLDGSKIGFSAVTWSTNVMPIIQLGMLPVPLDCEPGTLNVMSTAISRTLHEIKLDGLFLTNVLGLTGDMDRIQEQCDHAGIVLFEDNCEGLGTELDGKKAGNFGLASSFSFYVAHHMSTIEGGMVCTDNDEFAQMLKIVRANGWDRNLDHDEQLALRKLHGIESEFEAKYAFYDLAYNLRPTEITGFLGRHQLNYLEDSITKRQANFLRLAETTKTNGDLMLLHAEHISRLSNFAFPIVCRTPQLRQTYINRFLTAEIESRPLIAGNMQRQPFFKKYVSQSYDLPGANILHDCAFYCGNYPELTDDDLMIISGCLRAGL